MPTLEMIACVTHTPAMEILEEIKGFPKNGLKLYSKDETQWDWDLDESTVKTMKGSDFARYFLETVPDYLRATSFSTTDEGDSIEKIEHLSMFYPAVERLPIFSQILFNGLTLLPFEVITRYNLGALIFSWPFYDSFETETSSKKFIDWVDLNEEALDFLDWWVDLCEKNPKAIIWSW